MEFPVGTIILWTGSAGSIPDGWQIYSAAENKFIRGVPSGGTVEATGGTDTHDHDAGTIGQAGAHAHPEVTYDTGQSDSVNYLVTGTGFDIYAADGYHRHNGQKMSLGTNSNHGHTRESAKVGSANNLPPYKQAIYIVKV